MRSIKSVSLPSELMEIVEKNIDDFSGYVQDCIKKDFSLEYLKEKNIEDLKIIKKRKLLIKNIEKEKKNFKTNKTEEVGGIKETIRRPGRIIVNYK